MESGGHNDDEQQAYKKVDYGNGQKTEKEHVVGIWWEQKSGTFDERMER